MARLSTSISTFIDTLSEVVADVEVDADEEDDDDDEFSFRDIENFMIHLIITNLMWKIYFSMNLGSKMLIQTVCSMDKTKTSKSTNKVIVAVMLLILTNVYDE